LFDEVVTHLAPAWFTIVDSMGLPMRAGGPSRRGSLGRSAIYIGLERYTVYGFSQRKSRNPWRSERGALARFGL
jgi:hypothetical protein